MCGGGPGPFVFAWALKSAAPPPTKHTYKAHIPPLPHPLPQPSEQKLTEHIGVSGITEQTQQDASEFPAQTVETQRQASDEQRHVTRDP